MNVSVPGSGGGRNVRRLRHSNAARWLSGITRRYGSRAALIFFGLVALGTLFYGTVGTSQGGPNLALNAGSEVLGTLITVAVIAPIVRSTQEGNIRSYPTLNYRRFVDRSAAAVRQVQIMTTFSTLLKHRETEEFLATARRLLAKGVRIDVLLLHPDSLSAEQRQRELEGARLNVASAIYDNIRVLDGLAMSVREDRRRYLSVRLYDASASVIIHRWDDRGLISFLPTDRLAEEGSHLEVDMRSPLGAFVDDRFVSLWTHPRTISIDVFRRMRLSIHEAGQPPADVDASYVTLDQIHYVVSSRVLAACARQPNGTLRARQGDDPETAFQLVLVDHADRDLQRRLVESYEDKYGLAAHTFVCLDPVA
jgi:hypothetical protein